MIIPNFAIAKFALTAGQGQPRKSRRDFRALVEVSQKFTYKFLCKPFRRRKCPSVVFGIRQFVSEEACLKCQGCCRFKEAAGVWLPGVLNEEKDILKKNNLPCCQDKKIIPVFSEKESIFFCPLLNKKENKCVIYGERFFDCQLYPFVINRRQKKVYLAIDLNCVFVKNNFKTADFDKYVEYLQGLLNSQVYQNILRNNPQIIQIYPEVIDLVEIKA